jgi:biotin transport system substrate-specific component
MVGPTGGYLLGYLPAAALCGFLASRGWDRRIVMTALSMLLGTVVIYAFGLSWLGTVVGWDKPILAWGLTPFVLGDLLKIGLAVALLPISWKLLRR